jgi:hypothetical protein
VGVLRIGWAHPLQRDATVEKARKFLGATQRQQLDAFRAAVSFTASEVDSLAGASGAVVQFIALLTGKAA